MQDTSAPRWRECASADANVSFRLLPPTRDEPGLLVIVRADQNLIETCQLIWQPSEISSRPAYCPCCGTLLVARAVNDDSVRLRSAKLDNALAPPEADGATFGPPLTEGDWLEVAAEFWRENHPSEDEPA
jgi:hypothetical protein